MSWLSEESLLLAENWDTVVDIFEAEKRLRRELTSLLHSIESELAKREWWQEGWVFIPHQDAQVYISHRNWQVDRDFMVWIGVEGFTPEHIFGMESPPTLYVWVGRREYDLAQELAQAIEKREEEVLGELDHRTTGYVVRQAVKKCLPEEAESLGQTVRKQIVDFFGHYATVLWELDMIVREHLRKL